MTTFHADIAFDPAPDATGDMIEIYLASTGWTIVDATAENVTVSGEFDSREAAVQRLNDNMAILSECGYENVGAIGPVTTEELTS